MPDFFAHCVAGLVVPLSWRDARLRDYVLAVVLSTLPDVDSLTPWHRALTHSILVLVPLSVLTFAALRRLGYSRGDSTLLSALPHIHVAMDLLTSGLPVRLLFPLLGCGVQLDWALSVLVNYILSIAPVAYYPAAVRVSLVLLAMVLAVTLRKAIIASQRSL